MPSPPALEVRGLRRTYGAITAVDDVSFDAAPAAVTAVIGPNGAGKTTTVEICAGLRRASAGTVRVLGLDPHRDRSRLRPRVGVMPQSAGSGAAGVYPAARVRETLRQHAAFAAHPVDPDLLLERLDLVGVAGTSWRRLSGGEQQRLSLALALVARPELVFLDEPTAGLDVHARRSTWALVDELRGAGVTVVLTTHAMDEAERLADHVVLVDRGRVVASGSPALLADPTPRLTFDATPGLPVTELVGAVQGVTAAAETVPGHYEVVASVDPDLVAAVTAWCAARGALARRIDTGGRSLEDVFVELTGRAP